MSAQTDARCANGKPGYNDAGKSYNPKPACSQAARVGHIFCDRCREESGGVKLYKGI